MAPTLLKELWAVTRRHWVRLLLGSLLVALSNLLLVLSPLTLRHALLSMEGNPDPSLVTSAIDAVVGPSPQLLHWVALLLAMALAAAWCKYRMRQLFIAVSYRAEAALRENLFVRIQQHKRQFYDRHGVGDLMSHVTNDVAAVREVLGPGILYPVNFASLALPALYAMVSIEPPLTALSITPILLLPFVMWLARSGMYRLSRRVQELLAGLSRTVQEQLTAIRLVKSYDAESALLERFRHVCRDLFSAQLKLAVVQGLFFPLLGLITRATTVGLVLLTGYLVFSGWSNLPSADFVSFMWVQSYLFIPVLMLGWILPVYERGRAAYHRLWKLYSEPVEQQASPGTTSAQQPPSISVRDLHFQYEDGVPLLQGVNLDIPSGSLVGITGPIGEGKSTLLGLLAGEYTPIRGSISGGYQKVAFVEQDPFLFSKTIRENIELGNPNVTEEGLQQAIEQAQLKQTIEAFADHLDTLVGERGVTLSGGQKQRVVLARALVAGSPLLLLDDVFSGVDAATERAIVDHLQKMAGEYTIVVVAHRASVLDRLDTIHFLHNGHIVESGAPRQLREQGGYYAALTALQGWGT